MQGTADMLDELFGHMLAALRFGASQAACSTALDIAFELHPSQPQVQPYRNISTRHCAKHCNVLVLHGAQPEQHLCGTPVKRSCASALLAAENCKHACL